MKIYHLADVCTALECVCAVIILGMAFLRVAPEYALWVFFVGQMFDAVDGPLSRHFKYPDDGKKRWWREHNKLTDQLSDLLLDSVTCLYVALRINVVIGTIAFLGALIIGLVVQTLAYDFPPLRFNWLKTRPKLGHNIVIARRRCYVALLVFAVGFLLWSTRWILGIKIILTIILTIIGLVLFVWKKDRWNNVDAEP